MDARRGSEPPATERKEQAPKTADAGTAAAAARARLKAQPSRNDDTEGGVVMNAPWAMSNRRT